MPSFLALLAFLTAAGMQTDHVRIPTPGGVILDAALVRPTGRTDLPAVVALHGCGGPYPSRDGSWARELATKGHIVLLPDSFGSRGLGPQCRVKQRTVSPARERRDDAIAAATWLATQPGVPAGGIALLGWSNGGSTVLATARLSARGSADRSMVLPSGLFSRFVAFYPGCASTVRDMSWQPAARMLILVGEQDDWTPAEPCRQIADRFPDRTSPNPVITVAYPDAYHDFDAPDRPVRVLTGLATVASGQAHVGTNVAARTDALVRVPAFLATGR
jgi:dienelactone hydrolase